MLGPMNIFTVGFHGWVLANRRPHRHSPALVVDRKETRFGDEDLGCYIHLWGQDNWRWEFEDCKGLGRGARDVNMDGLRAHALEGN
jgi:hypothetical protein